MTRFRKRSASGLSSTVLCSSRWAWLRRMWLRLAQPVLGPMSSLSVRPEHARDGEVIWLPGDPIDVFENFEEALRSFIAYAERDLATFESGGGRVD